VPRLTLIMKMERAVWRLNEISLTVRLPLADQDFLKNLEDRQRSQNEQSAMASLNMITRAEQTYHAGNNTYACTLSQFSPTANTNAPNHGYSDPEIAGGQKGRLYFRHFRVRWVAFQSSRRTIRLRLRRAGILFRRERNHSGSSRWQGNDLLVKRRTRRARCAYSGRTGGAVKNSFCIASILFIL